MSLRRRFLSVQPVRSRRVHDQGFFALACRTVDAASNQPLQRFGGSAADGRYEYRHSRQRHSGNISRKCKAERLGTAYAARRSNLGHQFVKRAAHLGPEERIIDPTLWCLHIEIARDHIVVGQVPQDCST